MPDAGAVAASHDIVQMLFYFVCALGFAIACSAAAVFKFILLPLKDGALEFFKHQTVTIEAMAVLLSEMKHGDEVRKEMHEQNLKKLSEIYRVAEEIKNKIRCPVEYNPPIHQGAPGHA